MNGSGLRKAASRLVEFKLRKSLFFVMVALVAYFSGSLLIKNLGTVSRAGAVPDPQVVTVLSVVDAETILVRHFSGNIGQVRYIGLDVPKVSSDLEPECFEREAHSFNKSLVTDRRLRLVSDQTRRDSDGRMLAYAYRVSDGLFVNAELVRQGYALPASTPPNTTHADELRHLATRARLAGRGLWPKCRERTRISAANV